MNQRPVMRLRGVIYAIAIGVIVLALVLLIGGCSTSVDVEPQSNGMCKQERSKSFLGIDYGRSEAYVNCGER